MDQPIFSLYQPCSIGIAVSENGQWTAIQTLRGIDVYDRTGNLLSHYASIFDVTLSEWKRRFLLICADELAFQNQQGDFRILSLPDLEEIEIHDFSEWDIYSLVFNERWIVCAEKDGLLEVINRQGERSSWQLSTKGLPVLISENKLLLANDDGTSPHIVDLLTGKIIKEFPENVEVAPNLDHYLLNGENDVTVVFHVETQQPWWEFESGDTTRFCPDGTHIITRFDNSHYVLYNVESGAIVADFAIEASKNFPEISTQTLTQSEADGWVRQYDLFTGKPLQDIAYLPCFFPSRMAASGQYVAMQRSSSTVAVFDVNLAKIIWKKTRPSGYKRGNWRLRNVTIEGTLIVVQTDEHLEIWDFVGNQIVAVCPIEAEFAFLAYPYLYVIGWSKRRQYWDLLKFDIEQQMIVRSYGLMNWDPSETYWSGEYGFIIGTPESPTCSLYDIDNLTYQRKIDWQGSSSAKKLDSPLRYNADLIAITTYTGVTLFSVKENAVLQELFTDEDTSLLCISEDSQTLVFSSGPKHSNVEFWRPFESSGPVFTIYTEAHIITACFADDRTLVTSHADGTVNFWDITHITKGLV